MMGTDGVFDAYESTIQGEAAAEGFIPDLGVRLVVGWTAEGVPAWYAETDMMPGPHSLVPLIKALTLMAEQLSMHALGVVDLHARGEGQ